MIKREAESELINLAKQFKAVAVVGPRQLGKIITVKFFHGILYWFKICGEKNGAIIYTGESGQRRSNNIDIVTLNKLDSILV
jgi:hypothetical protein